MKENDYNKRLLCFQAGLQIPLNTDTLPRAPSNLEGELPVNEEPRKAWLLISDMCHCFGHTPRAPSNLEGELLTHIFTE